MPMIDQLDAKIFADAKPHWEHAITRQAAGR
jgi:hypothetical protein